MAMILRVDPRYIPFLAPETTNTNGPRRLYATLAMESTYVHLTSAKSGELPRHTLAANELQGLHEGGTRYRADEYQCGRTPNPDE